MKCELLMEMQNLSHKISMSCKRLTASSTVFNSYYGGFEACITLLCMSINIFIRYFTEQSHDFALSSLKNPFSHTTRCTENLSLCMLIYFQHSTKNAEANETLIFSFLWENQYSLIRYCQKENMNVQFCISRIMGVWLKIHKVETRIETIEEK